MTPEQLREVQASYASLDADALDRLATSFYAHLFSAHPELRSLFSREPALQRQKFIDELTEIIHAISNLSTFVKRTNDLGARHVPYGTRTVHYGQVGDALLAALADELGTAFTDDLREAWTLAYNLVAETMMQGASSVRSH